MSMHAKCCNVTSGIGLIDSVFERHLKTEMKGLV